MNDPQPISVSLPDARRRLMRAIEPGPELDPDLEGIRRRGMEEILAAQWSHMAWSRFAGATWDLILDDRARDQLERWAAARRKPNLIILGPVGTGKTSAAAVVLRESHLACLEVNFVSAVEMMTKLRPGTDDAERAEFRTALYEVDRLLIDDIGKENRTDFTVEQLDAVISARYNEERPLVVTSNFNQADLEAHLGPHAADRLFGEGAVVVVIKGQSRRRA